MTLYVIDVMKIRGFPPRIVTQTTVDILPVPYLSEELHSWLGTSQNETPVSNEALRLLIPEAD